MEAPAQRILLVESDPQISQMIAQETLRPMGYQVDVFESASMAIKEIDQISPDLIITNLYLPEISGKDLLVVLKSQGVNLPIIAITPKGHESDALQAFRLGAMNFLTYPLREAEIINVVEDTLNKYRNQKKLEDYAQQLAQIKEEMKLRTSSLVEIFSIGKLGPSAKNQQALYEKVICAAVSVTQADMAWMSVYDSNQNKYILRACQNTDEEIQSKLNQPYQEGLSAILAVSGEAISLNGEALQRFYPYASAQSMLIVPIKWKNEVIGMIATARKSPQPFTQDQQGMLELIAEYASILIENSRRFQIMEQKLFQVQQASAYAKLDSDLKNDLMHQASLELREPLKSLKENLDQLSSKNERRLSLKQADSLHAIQEEADILIDIANSLARIQPESHSRNLEEIDLNEVVRHVVEHFQWIALVCRITIKPELKTNPVMVTVFPYQISKVIEGLISNALKYSPPKSHISVRVEEKEQSILLSVEDQGEGVDEELAERLFDKKSSIFGEKARRFGGIGISLPMIKEIVTAHRGEAWVDSSSGKGFRINISLPQS